VEQDRSKALRIISLIKDVQRDLVQRHRKTRAVETRIKGLLVKAHQSGTPARLSGDRRENQDSGM
jgi:hypothetical protein